MMMATMIEEEEEAKENRRRINAIESCMFVVCLCVCVLFVRLLLINTNTFPTLSPLEAPASQSANQPVFTSLMLCAIFLCFVNGVKIKTENKPIQRSDVANVLIHSLIAIQTTRDVIKIYKQ